MTIVEDSLVCGVRLSGNSQITLKIYKNMNIKVGGPLTLVYWVQPLCQFMEKLITTP